MKFFNITLLFVIFALACLLSCTHAEDAKRTGLRRPVGKVGGKGSTTTALPAEEEEGDYAEGEEGQYPDEGEDASSTTTTTTETPKRVGPVIRPFRSNDDFLNSLKRRQMNAKKNKLEKAAAKPVRQSEDEEGAEETAPVGAQPAPAKAFNKPNSALSRRKLNKPGKPEPAEDAAAEETENEEESKPKRTLGRLALRKRV